MSGGQSANSFLETLEIRRKLALQIFLGVMLVVGVGAFLTLQYSASAVVAIDPHSLLDQGAGRTETPVDLTWTALTDNQIQAIIQQFQLNSGITRLRARNQIFTYVRSNILLRKLDSGGSGAPTVQISFASSSPSSAIGVANAIAQSLARPTAAAPGPKQQNVTANSQNLSEELDKVRTTLQLLNQTKNSSVSQNGLQKRSKTLLNLEAARRETVVDLAALDQQAAQAAITASKAKALAQTQALAPPPPNPQAIALEQQIKQAQAHLAQLRQRYTEEYPEVQEAEATLANLDGRLSRIPIEKPRPRPIVQGAGATPEEIGITAARNEVLERQQGLDEAIRNAERNTGPPQQRVANSKTFAQDYEFEQQRYNTLLKQQQQEQQSATKQPSPVNAAAGGTGMPRYIIVQSATNASANGLAVKPFFWVFGVLAALFIACFSTFVTEQFNPAEDDPTPRSFHTN